MLSSIPETHRVAYNQETNFTWSDFKHRVTDLIFLLEERPEHKIAICCKDAYLFSIALMAAFYAKKHIVLPGNYQTGALQELDEHYQLLLCDKEITPPTNTPHIFYSLQPYAVEKNYQFKILDVAQSSLTFFTSGSSGTPKAIHKTGENLALEVDILHQTFTSKNRGTKVISSVSHQHIYGLAFRLLLPLCEHRAFSSFNDDYPEQIFAHADADTILISSPALLKRLDIVGDKQTQLAGIFSAGGPLNKKAITQSNVIFQCDICEIFGTTETGAVAHRIRKEEDTPWTLLADTKGYLNADQCLVLSSPHISKDTPFETSDACNFINNNQFLLIGRTDRIVKIEEKRISLVEIEKRLESHIWLEDAAVLSVQGKNRTEIGAIITLSTQGKIALEKQSKGAFTIQIRQDLRQWIEPVGIPRRFRIMDAIPVNTQGKRLVKELVTYFEDK